MHWLSYMNLSDPYERKARFLPGLITVLFLLPVSAALEGPVASWIEIIVVGVGIGGAIAVGISHLASAFGNRLQEKIWPRWPFDSPTNQWLLPGDQTRSERQKAIWYSAIKRQTGFDIPGSDIAEIEKVINDAISNLRYQLRNSEHADRLRVHNEDYGFARNFAGLWPIWLTFSILSVIGCWAAYLWAGSKILWGVISTGLLIMALILAFVVLPDYVRQKAKHYAESFFGAVIERDREDLASEHFVKSRPAG